MKKSFSLLVSIIFLVVIFSSSVFAEQIVVNSNNWQDVYTSLNYGGINGFPVNHLSDESQGLDFINEVIRGSERDLLLVEGDAPLVFGFENQLKIAGFNVRQINQKNINLGFARKQLEKNDTTGLVIVDGNFGYNAIAVASYSHLTNSIVVFATKDNVNDIVDLIENYNPSEILLYGQVDRVVRDRISPLATKIIYHQDRYKDNFELIDLFIKIKPTQQVFFVDGEFIEAGLFNGEFPTLLIGKSNVPESVIDYILNSDFKTSVAVGYDLYSNARKIKQKTGIRLFLKYGIGRNEQMYALNIFPLPKFDPLIEISSVNYNTVTKNLEVTYRNTKDLLTYVQGFSHKIYDSGGELIATLGDNEAIFLGGLDSFTVSYDIDLLKYMNRVLNLESIVAFGEAPNSLSRLLNQKSPILFEGIKDDSDIKIIESYYNKRTKRFEIMIENVGPVSVFVDPQIFDFKIGADIVTLSGEETEIGIGNKKLFKIFADLEEIDLEENKKYTVKVRYGGSEGILIKLISKDFQMVIKSFDVKLIALIIIVMVLLFLIFIILKRRKEQENYDD